MIELVVAHAGLAQSGRHRRHDRAALEQAVPPQQRLTAAALEVVPELERAHGQPHVVGIGMREAEGARLVAGATEVVADRVLLEQRHAPAALGEDPRGSRAHRAGTDHDGRATAAAHATARLRSASTAPSRSACTASAT